MKRLASSLLSEERFWAIIDSSDKGKDLERELSKLAEDEILGYRYWWNHFHRESYHQALWAVAYVVLGGCSDDCFDYFRYWLLTRGKSVYTKAVENADSLCAEFEALTDEEYPEWEDVNYVPIEVFKKKFGKDLYAAEDDVDFGVGSFPEINFEWDEEDEDSIRKVCPNTFDKWWDNDKF